MHDLIKEYLLEQEKKTKLDHLKANYLDDKKSKKAPKIGDVSPQDTGIANPEVVDKKKTTFKRRKKIPESYLIDIVLADPTSVVPQDAVKADQIEKVGAYTQWIVNRYFDLIPEDYSGKKDPRFADIKESVRLFFEDLYKVKNDLLKFNRFKSQLPKKDINQIKSVRELYELTKDINLEDAVLTHKQKQEKLKNADIQAKKQGKHNADYVYEDAKWEVLVPKTHQAAADISAEPLTRWCTADLSRNYFASYTEKGPLYIIRDKTNITKPTSIVAPNEPKPMYQFEFSGGHFFDKEDSSLNIQELCDFLNENQGLKTFFQPMFKKALGKEKFNMSSTKFKTYIRLYGAGEDITKLVKESLTEYLSEQSDLTIKDEDGDDYINYIEMLGYDVFLKHVFNHLPQSPDVFEVMLSKYNGSGFVIPDNLTQKTSISNLILSGFVRKLPENLGDLQSLIFLSLQNNPTLSELPASIGNLNLHILNILDTPVKVPQSIRDAGDKLDMIIIE